MKSRFVASLLVIAIFALRAHSAEPESFRIETEVTILDLHGYFRDHNVVDPQRQIDTVYFLVSLQGLVNREAPRLYILATQNFFEMELMSANPGYRRREVTDVDRFWLEYMGDKGYVDEEQLQTTSSLETVVRRFRSEIKGLVLWDLALPATVNVAQIASGCEDLLVVRHDPAPGSFHQRLVTKFPDLEVRLNLAGRFTGSGPLDVGEKTIPSTGSAKNDAYRFALERYLASGKCDPFYMWYNCDAARWGNLPAVYAPGLFDKELGHLSDVQNIGMYNADYWIARRAFILDLSPWGDEAPNDDPRQPLGTDLDTWHEVLETSYRLRQGEFGMVAGFPTWWMKYTDLQGGKHPPVPTEWEFIALITSYNCVNEGDAAFGIANASFFMHLPQLTQEECRVPDPPPIVPKTGTTYLAFFMMDYDGSAWVNQMVPAIYLDEQRGKIPLNWCINPVLHKRIPHAMRYLYENRTANDYFGLACDGAGYLSPTALTERRGRIAESGIPHYERYCRRLFERYGIRYMAYYISPTFDSPWIDMAARLTPKGFNYGFPVFKHRLVGDTPVSHIHMWHHAQESEFRAELRAVFQRAQADPGRTRIRGYRMILWPPSLIVDALAQCRGEFPKADVRIVDAANFFRLIKRQLTDPVSAYTAAGSVSAQPGTHRGLEPIPASGGEYQVREHQGVSSWVSPVMDYGGGYLYFDADDGFCHGLNGAVEVRITLLDRADTSIVLQYDSTDPAAPLDGAYKNAARVIECRDTGLWRTETLRLDDVRFDNRQNGGSDFRFHRGQTPLWVREIIISKTSD